MDTRAVEVAVESEMSPQLQGMELRPFSKGWRHATMSCMESSLPTPRPTRINSGKR